MAKNINACPFYIRKCAGTYYYGIKCSNYWNGNYSLGENQVWNQHGWDKDKRDEFVKLNCTNEYEKCSYYLKKVGI